MQKYSDITETFACTRKMLAFMFSFGETEELKERQSINFFRNMFNTKAIKISNFISVTK